jgi:predicted nucleic acid-binding protein
LNYFDSNIIIYAILDDTGKGEWARNVLEKVQNEEILAFTSFLTMPNMRFIDVNDSVI